MPFLDNTYFWVNSRDLRDKIGQKRKVAVWSCALWSFLRKKNVIGSTIFWDIFFPHTPLKKNVFGGHFVKKNENEIFFSFFLSILIDIYSMKILGSYP